MATPLRVTGDEEADALLNSDPLALVIGMLLDQQVPMEWAFMGPLRLQERLGELDAAAIAEMPPEKVEEVFKEKPALHRFPGSMGKRTHELCRFLVENYDGDASRIWKGVRSADELYRRLCELPGYGEEKSRIFMAILAKRFARKPKGWEEIAGAFADSKPRSVADIDSPTALEEVRAYKKSLKAAGRDKQGRKAPASKK